MTDDEIREVFEAACKKSKAEGKANFPLAPMLINGRFHHYMDPDTDNAWMGFRLGYIKGVVSKREEVLQISHDRDHWKANHDAQVERARLLHERPDLPLERVQAYDQVGRMRTALESIASLKAAALAMIQDQSIPETAITTAGLKEAVRIAGNALKEQ